MKYIQMSVTHEIEKQNKGVNPSITYHYKNKGLRIAYNPNVDFQITYTFIVF